MQRPIRTSRNPAITKPRPPSATRIIIRKPAYLQNANNCVQNIPNQPVKEQQLELSRNSKEPVEEQQLEPVEEQQLEPVEEQQLEPVEEQQLELVEEQQLYTSV